MDWTKMSASAPKTVALYFAFTTKLVTPLTRFSVGIVFLLEFPRLAVNISVVRH